jgi:hypothetical protein
MNTKETEYCRYDAALLVGAFDGVRCFIRKLNRNNFIRIGVAQCDNITFCVVNLVEM